MFSLELLLLFCIISGFFTGIIGIGAGILLMPILISYGFSISQAVATSLFVQAMPEALPGAIMYYQQGLLRIRESFYILIAVIIGLILGSYIGARKLIDEEYLFKILGVILICIGVYFLTKSL